MKGLPFILFAVAAICAVIGMAWGIVMSASGDHTLSPAHAHLNLLGWVSLALFGTFYHLVPNAGASMIAKIQAAVAIAGVVLIVPGIAMAINQAGEALAKIGSLLTILSMVIFLIVLVTKGRAPA
ncbi:hypothetical protein ACRARG_13725 [Pseudooceanicola sp. C21-150M6]|uniref:hypothetical protein n=1 Tax=Pseudooceanicola sp. C21-150M6 TaxID=3434355 RepID=UPI003D7F22A5